MPCCADFKYHFYYSVFVRGKAALNAEKIYSVIDKQIYKNYGLEKGLLPHVLFFNRLSSPAAKSIFNVQNLTIK